MAEQQYIRSIGVGAARVTLISIGDLRFDLAKTMKIDRQTHGYEHIFGQPLRIPIQCMLISTPTAHVLVDASRYEIPPDSPYALPGYQPPPGLIARLAEIGVAPDQIDQVIITHLHFDHYSSLTEAYDGRYVPCFPNARVYVGRADLESAEIHKALQKSDSLAGRTLSVIQQSGLLEPVTGNRDLGSGIQIIAAPGETPGHQIVRLHSEGQTFYSLGDLYHHSVEIERPEWGMWWADPAATQASRHALVDAALRENALISATHLRTVGRLRRTASGVTWDDV